VSKVAKSLDPPYVNVNFGSFQVNSLANAAPENTAVSMIAASTKKTLFFSFIMLPPFFFKPPKGSYSLTAQMLANAAQKTRPYATTPRRARKDAASSPRARIFEKNKPARVKTPGRERG
jgi:hypothetical protein